MKLERTIEECRVVFRSKTTQDSNGCWILPTRRPDGYSVTCLAPFFRKAYSGHRISYFLWKGEIPKGLEIDHICNVRNCVNPEHLEAVTRQQNADRIGEESRRRMGTGSRSNGREGWRKSHCKRGHELTEENTEPYPHNGKILRRCKICKPIRKRERESRIISSTLYTEGLP